MRAFIWILAFGFAMHSFAEETPAQAYKRWVRFVSSGRFPHGMPRAKFETRLAGKLIGQIRERSVYQADGTGILAYYALDSHHAVAVFYNAASMTVVGKPNVVSNTTSLHENLAKHALK